MNMNEWNRKDAAPESTIKRIHEILSEIGVNTKVIANESYNELWFSNRIEIEGLKTIGTNGKGITAEYTMASALGEFMERMQSGILLRHLFPAMREETKCKYDINELIAGVEKFFAGIFSSMNERQVENVVVECMSDSEQSTYTQIGDGDEIKVPKRLVEILCGSNGVAAGNTYEEAFVQGMGEIFERYVMQYIYENNYLDTFAVINESAYKNLRSYKLIQAIKERKYHVYVIDCSLGGRLPVVGVAIFDPGKSKYYFKLGSDINVDIALQRCITEIFQGNSFGLNFKLMMKEFLFVDAEEEKFWFDNKRAIEHAKAEIDGTGNLPRGFLRCLSNEIEEIRGFASNIKTNKEAVRFMLKCCKKMGKEVAVSNCTTLGFPCVRVLVQDACAAMHYPNAKIEETVISINRFRYLAKNKKAQSEEALENMITILNYPAYTYEFNMSKLFGIILEDENAAPYLYSPYLFTAYLALCMKKMDLAHYYIEYHNQQAKVDSRIAKADILAIKAIKDKVSREELLEYIKPADKDGEIGAEIVKLYNIYENGIELPTCPACDKCVFASLCSYSNYEKIMRNISIRKSNNCMQEYTDFLEECNTAMNDIETIDVVEGKSYE